MHNNMYILYKVYVSQTHTYIYIYIYIHIYIYINPLMSLFLAEWNWELCMQSLYIESLPLQTFKTMSRCLLMAVFQRVFFCAYCIYIYIQYCIYIYTHRIYTHACIWFKIYIGIAMANMTHVCSNMLARNVQHANLGRPNKHGKTYLHTCDIFDTHIYIQYTHTLYIYIWI